MFHLELMAFSEVIRDTIPEHRAYISRLFSEGCLISYSVSATRDEIWCVVVADDEFDAMGLIASFPLSPFFADVTCIPLLFHNTVTTELPGISLN